MQAQFEVNLSLTLAHSVVCFLKEELSPNGIVDDARNGEGDLTAGEVLRKQVRTFLTKFPQMAGTLNSQIGPNELAQAMAEQQAAPIRGATEAALYDTTGRALNKTGREISRENQLSQAATDAEVAGGSGMSLARSVDSANRVIDPEFYRIREQAGGKLGELLSGGLSGSERAEIDRQLGRQNAASGVSNVGSASTAVGNAMQFGEAGRSKLQQAIQLSQGFLPASRTSSLSTDALTGRNIAPNLGDTKFSGVKQGTGDQVAQFAGGYLGETGQGSRQQGQSSTEKTLGAIPDY